MRHIHVAPHGSAAGTGAAEAPFATLAQARDAARGQASTVWLHGGDYPLAETFTLTAADSGTAFRAVAGEYPRLLGGVVLDNWAPVTDPGVLARLSPEARARVRVADLRGIDPGAFRRRGFSIPITPAHLELYFDGVPQTVAQWPKAGAFTTITGVLAPKSNEWGETVGELHGGFTFAGDRPQAWAPNPDLWVHGYWSWDWANSYEHVARLDAAAHTLHTDPPHGLYAFKAGQRFYFLNVLEELSTPGEYVVHGNALYFWPPAEAGEALVSVLEAPLVRLDGASDVILHGLTLEAGRGSGVEIHGGSGVTLADCTLRNLGNVGVIIRDGTGHRVTGCEVAHTGDAAIDIQAGDRATLTPANHVVDDCHLHHYARWSRTYQAAVHVGGVGARVAHNLIHDAPHTAVLYWGNEVEITGNEIYRVCLETGDAGAIYTGRDYTFRGNAIRDNFIHHMGGVGMGTAAIYMDDCVSGHDIGGNTVWYGDGIWLGGGRDFFIHDNLFVACRKGIAFDARGVSTHAVWRNMVHTTMRARFEAMHADAPPYSARYPALAALPAFFAAGAGVPPEGNTVARCRAVACPLIVLAEWEPPHAEWLAQADNTEGDPGFLDPAWGDFRTRASDPVAGPRRPLPLVRSRLTCLTQDDDTVTVRLALRNDGPLPAAGTMALGSERWPYTLEPGEIAESTFTVPVPGAYLEAYDLTGTARPARWEKR
jgi:hypothetical protein